MPTKTEKFGECLSASEAARILGRSVSTLSRWRRLSIGPPYLRDPHNAKAAVMYPRTALVAWNEDRLVLHKPVG